MAEITIDQMRDKIQEYLSSSDIEMNQLGATIMKHELPREEWIDMLDKHCREEDATIYVGTNDLGEGGKEPVTIPGAKRFSYMISDNEIQISQPSVYWQPLNNTAVGYHAMYQTTTGSSSTAIGQAALSGSKPYGQGGYITTSTPTATYSGASLVSSTSHKQAFSTP